MNGNASMDVYVKSAEKSRRTTLLSGHLHVPNRMADYVITRWFLWPTLVLDWLCSVDPRYVFTHHAVTTWDQIKSVKFLKDSTSFLSHNIAKGHASWISCPSHQQCTWLTSNIFHNQLKVHSGPLTNPCEVNLCTRCDDCFYHEVRGTILVTYPAQGLVSTPKVCVYTSCRNHTGSDKISKTFSRILLPFCLITLPKDKLDFMPKSPTMYMDNPGLVTPA